MMFSLTLLKLQTKMNCNNIAVAQIIDCDKSFVLHHI